MVVALRVTSRADTMDGARYAVHGVHARVLHTTQATWRSTQSLRPSCVACTAAQANVVTTGIKPSSNIDSALVSAMYGRSSELGLYLWGNPPLPTVQGLPPPVGGG